jgi:cytoskeletal protein CcmA (bactofilin family)
MLKKKDSLKHDKNTALAKRKSVPSIIADDMNILGNLISDGCVDINGHIEGNVKCHDLTIREHGVIKGDVFAESVHVHGQVSGVIKARHVFLSSTARVRGVIMHESMTMEAGAFIDGQCKHYDRAMGTLEAPPSTGSGKSDNIELIENFRVISS